MVATPICNLCIVDLSECLQDRQCLTSRSTKLSALSAYVHEKCGSLQTTTETLLSQACECPTHDCPTCPSTTSTCAPCPILARSTCYADLRKCRNDLSFLDLSKNGAQGRDSGLEVQLRDAQANATASLLALELCSNKSDVRCATTYIFKPKLLNVLS